MKTGAPHKTISEEKVTGILGYGYQIAWSRKGDRTTIEDAVWAALGDAMDVLDASPDRERVWLRSGTQAASWNNSSLSRDEALATEKLRTLAGIRTQSAPRIHRERDLDRAMQTLDWMLYVRSARNGDRLAKAAIALLRGDEKATAAAIFRPDRPHDRRAPYLIRKMTARAILQGIERQFGELSSIDGVFQVV